MGCRLRARRKARRLHQSLLLHTVDVRHHPRALQRCVAIAIAIAIAITIAIAIAIAITIAITIAIAIP